MLIREAELLGQGLHDVRIAGGRVVQIASRLERCADELLIEAQGGLLIPGLHDHHLHLRALAAALASVDCGPPAIASDADLRALLRRLDAQARVQPDWIRGVGYHESVAGPIDRSWLDAAAPTRALRIQHRSGRMWVFNSAALAALGVDEGAPPGSDPFERIDGRLTGRLYDADAWLRTRLRAASPSLKEASLVLARRGVTGVTDTSPANGPDELREFAAARQRGELLQDLCAMGDRRLHGQGGFPGVVCGAMKFHLHEHELPEFEDCVAAVRGSHGAQRACAFHCVTRTELAFALTVLQEAGGFHGDRIEHAGVVPPEWEQAMKAQRVIVVTQPGFIAERGDQYLEDVAGDDRPWLYRLRGLMEAGIAVALSTDAPYGRPDPWAAMQAAVDRRTHQGRVIGAAEAISPEQALEGFLRPALDPSAAARRVETGVAADLCLLDRSWEQARPRLADVGVRACLRAGVVIWSAEAESSQG